MNFTICVEPSGEIYVTERNENFNFIKGIIDPASVYNMRISPGRNFNNWANVIAAACYKQTGKTVKFAYGEGNYNVSSRLNDELKTVFESSDIPVKSLPEPLFIPEYYNFSSYSF